jgi:hypothetical protein
MEATRTKTNFALILKLDALATSDQPAPFAAHLVLNRLLIDEDGNVCLTKPMGLHSLLDAIDDLKSELDGLANDAILWVAGSIASRRARFAIFSNGIGGVGEKWTSDGDGSTNGTPSPVRQPAEIIQLLPRGS